MCFNETQIICITENYIIFWEYIKYVFPSLIEVMGPIMNLISRTYHFCEKKKYAFNILPKHDIIIRITPILLFVKL